MTDLIHDFWLIISEGHEWAETAVLEREIWKHIDQPDARAILRIESGYPARDVTEDSFHNWKAANWEPGDKVPALFQQFADRDMQLAAERAEQVGFTE